MSKITNWSPLDNPNPTTWSHDERDLRLYIEKNWLVQGEEYDGYRVVRGDNGERIAYSDTIKDAREDARSWMKDNPLHDDGDFKVGDIIKHPDGTTDEIMKIDGSRVRVYNSDMGGTWIDKEDIEEALESGARLQ